MQDVEQNYLEAIEEGDRKFTGKNYEGAIVAFERAGELKPDESYPPERIAAAQQAIADLEKQKEEEALLAQQQEEEARLKELEAEQAKLRKEFDQIVASGDEFIAAKEYQNAVTRYNEALALIPDDQPVQQKLANAEQLLSEMLANRSVDKQFNMILADADALFKAEDFDRALAKYTEAQAVKPSDKYTAERITTIEKIIAARQQMSEKQKQAELEAQRQREEEEAERLRLAQQQQELEAVNEEYNTYIEVADRKMGQSEYDVALRNYQEALALKPDEFYPKSRIQEIELLIQEQEERRAEEERLAALEAERERNRGNKRRGGASVDSDTEDEAERFMREARLREEAEKYFEAGLNSNEVEDLLNSEEKRVEILNGEWEQGSNPIVDYYIWNGPLKSGFNPDLSFIKGNIAAPEPKTLNEAKGLYISAYQDYLEKNWIKSLRKKHKIKVRKRLLKSIPHVQTYLYIRIGLCRCTIVYRLRSECVE